MTRLHTLSPSRQFSARAAVAALTVAATIGLASCAQRHSNPVAPANVASVQEEWLRKYPPVTEKPAQLDQQGREWTTLAWLSTNDSLCVASIRTSRPTGDLVSCMPAPAALLVPGPPTLPSKPLPHLGPVNPDDPKLRLFVGTVRGPAATVDVTVFGTTATAPVVAFSTADQRHVGVYAVWLPTAGQGGFHWSDITSVIARSATGDITARLS